MSNRHVENEIEFEFLRRDDGSNQFRELPAIGLEHPRIDVICHRGGEWNRARDFEIYLTVRTETLGDSSRDDRIDHDVRPPRGVGGPAAPDMT